MSRLGSLGVVVSAGLLLLWLLLLTGTGALPAGLAAAAAFLGLGLWRPRLALGALVAFAASTPLLATVAGASWFSPAEGGLLALWLAVQWRERSAPRRPLDLAGTLVLCFGLYVLLATVALVVRYQYASWGLGLSLLSHPLADLLLLKQALPFYGLRGGTLLLEGMLAFQLARRVDAEPGEGRATLWGLWTGGCLAAASYFVYYLPRLLEPAKNWITYRPALTLHDANSAASFGLLVLGAGLAMATRRRRLAPLFLIPGLFILFLGGSRVAILIALVGVLGVVVAILRARRQGRGRPLQEGDLAAAPALAPALAVLVILVAATGFYMARSQNYQRFVTGEVFTTYHFSGRLGLWESGLRMVAHYPLSGVGAGEFARVLPEYVKEGTAPIHAPHENAHCYPLQLAAEYGVPALLLWALLLWAILAPRVRQWRVLSPESAGLLVGTLFYVLHSLQSHPLLLPEQQILFWAALGGLAGHFSRLSEPSGPSAIRWVALLCLAAPLWSITQGVPAAHEARIYGRYASDAASGPWAWTAPRCWILAEGRQPTTFDFHLARPDLRAGGPEVTVSLSSGERPLWSGRYGTQERLRVTLSPPADGGGALLLLEVDPPLVPQAFDPSLRDRRPLGLLMAGPRPWAEGDPAPPPPGAAAAEVVAAEPIPPEARRCECTPLAAPETAGAGETFPVRAAFRNGGAGAWSGASLVGTERQLSASYHWIREDGSTQVWDGVRTPLSADIPPGETWEATLSVAAPAVPGRYRLRLDLVQEQVAWFGCAGGETAVEVRAPAPSP